ncbi:hypothetical protein N7449_000525 [Penicillium cf. viridicatum]|uniref:Uncharacterized protein n=1 Tax=Penicillium cf. viridicatum TaxID=2972119 RepID=A0A9W9N544_9EURO|nr:hypothetical protein N7449_000525 [Penicillium cf. viridicatum]
MDDSKQKIREQIISHIPDVIQYFLRTVDSTPIRILGDTPNSLLDPGNYLGSIRPFVSNLEDAIRESRPDSQTCFLAVKIYPGKHSYFVVDLNNVDYAYETAHKDMSLIPTYILRLSKKPTIFRKQPLDKTLAETLAALHDGHGQEPLPLFEDHNQLVQYPNPRSLQR